jgi:hypothetical protein
MGCATKIIIVLFILYLIYKEFIEETKQIFIQNEDILKCSIIKDIANQCCQNKTIKIPTEVKAEKIFVKRLIK